MHLLDHKKKNGSIGIIHFVGIGGIGMSGIATIMSGMGYEVQGSDISSNSNIQRLKNLGIKIFTTHEAKNIDNVKYVVISSAISQNNPEVQEAIKKGLPVIPRSQMLAELMRFKTCIAVSGSHGKTTTTSMMAHIFEEYGVNPTVINGGIINCKDTNAYLGSSDYLITEADESDATFIRIPATIAIITNIAIEHMDFYGSFEKLVESFNTFIYNLPFYGFAVCCIDQPIVQHMIEAITTKQIITYGIENPNANVRAFNIELDSFSSVFDVQISSPNLGSIIIKKIHLAVPGRHNILNALAAIAVAVELDFGIKVIQKAFSSFKGVKRRFTKVGQYKQINIIDDYAHHPAEIRATIATAKNAVNIDGGKLIVVCQPHRYSRFISLFAEFKNCFDLADVLYIAPIYSAGEENPTSVNHKQLVDNITHDKVYALDALEDFTTIAASLEDKCIVLMLGAGDITYYANALEQKLHDYAARSKQ